jgi:hypothetical protein
MKKIIRLTESELIKMIGKVINEQQSTPEQAIAREFAGGAGGPGSNLPVMANALKKIKNLTQYEEVNKILKGINGMDIAGYINDECGYDNAQSVKAFITILGRIGVNASANYYKDPQKGGEYFRENSFKIIGTNAPGKVVDPKADPKAVKSPDKTPAPKVQQQNKTVFVANEKFPLMFQQKGEAIKKIQTALGIKPTGNFWTLTEKAVLAKAPEYKRATGITEDIYNKIVGGQTTVTPNVNQQLLQRGQDFTNKNIGTIKQNSQRTPQQQAEFDKLNIRQ